MGRVQSLNWSRVEVGRRPLLTSGLPASGSDMAQNLKDFAGRLPSGPRGMGTALKLLLGVGVHRGRDRGRAAGHHTGRGPSLQDPWFQYPIIYDIRARPRKISSPTGSKGRSGHLEVPGRWPHEVSRGAWQEILGEEERSHLLGLGFYICKRAVIKSTCL